MSTPPVSYPVQIDFDVHWGDMDAFGHVNNTRYFTWFESCRIAYFMRIGLRVHGPSQLGPILAHISCDYLVPVVYPAHLVCGARVSKIGTTSFTMIYGLWQSSAPADLCARGMGVIVLVDYATGQKVPVPPEVRKAIHDLEGWAEQSD